MASCRILLCAIVAVFCAGASAGRTVSVAADGKVAEYDLADMESAAAYVAAYAENVQHDGDFKAHEEEALLTIRREKRFFGTWWAVLPPLIAIFLTLVTKEVYSSMFAGIVAGGILFSGGAFEGAMKCVVTDGFVKSVADPYNVGILLFLVLLGAIVAMMNRTGASAAFGSWAQRSIRSRFGAQAATALLGLAIFIDDYFNCLTVGGVMRPVTDAKQVSRAKLAYLIDATAAPICIIAPISSWAAAVAGFAKGAGAESGIALFVSAIPYNFYAILTIVTIFAVAWLKLDFGPMRSHEEAVLAGRPDPGSTGEDSSEIVRNRRGKVCDLFVPMVVLTLACVVGMIHSGGFFGGEADGDFVKAFGAADASAGLACGAMFGAVFALAFYLCRRVISFRDCMASFPEGFKMMVPAIMILCCAWTLKSVTDALGARVFISDVINGSAASLLNFLPAIVFVIAAVLAFSTGTSWGTFGVLIPIVLAAVPGSQLTVVAISACMAGAVCGDHCSPISDTTIMASAGAQCTHVAHVSTQLPYVVVVAAVSFASYLVAPFVGSAWISLPIAVVLMLATLLVIRRLVNPPTRRVPSPPVRQLTLLAATALLGLAAGCSLPTNPFGTPFSRGLERLRNTSVDGGEVTLVDFHPVGRDLTGRFTNMPAFVEVNFELKPSPGSLIRCSLLLPHHDKWDGRLWGLGPDTPEMEFNEATVDFARRGSASVCTDGGATRGGRKRVAEAGAKRPEVWKDFGWRGVHLMTREAKRLAAAFYGRDVERSYFRGVCAAGAQALMLAQRFPDDYDGILAVSPEIPRTSIDVLALHVARNAHDAFGRPVFTASQSRALAAAALDCDTKTFTPEAEQHVFRLASRLDRSLENPDLRARWHRVFEGPRHVKGKILYDGIPLGADLGSGFRRTPWSMKWYFGADADLFMLGKADLARYVSEIGPQLDATDPDLSKFAARGGKLVVVAGMVDPVTPHHFVTGYAARAAEAAGGAKRLESFARFFTVPGMARGFKDAPVDSRALETALVEWTEKGSPIPAKILRRVGESGG